ncbi:MAG: PH domain-containing protein, partial [Oscillospiraceae bacterium]
MDKGIRCHFSSIIANTLKTTWVFIAFVVFSLTDEISSIQESGISSSSAFISIGVFLAIIIAIALFNFFRWRKTFFYVEDGNLVVDKRQLIEQKKTTVKLSSIATVNFQQGIIDRIFNTYRLQIDINSSVTADKTDFNIVLSRSIAEEFKKSLTPDAPDKIDSDGNTVKAKSDDITPIFEFSTDRVIKHGLLSISVGSVVLSAIMLAGVLIAQFQDSSAKSSVFSSIIAILLVVGPILVQCVSPFIRYLNFKIGKQNDKAVISYGLITKRQFSVPLEKINAVVLKQPILARFFNLYYGELISVGMGDEENQQTPVFCLLVTKQELDSILSELAPQFVIKGIGEASP